MAVVKANVGDLDAIRGLLDFYSRNGVLTPRTGRYLRRHLSEFLVYQDDGVLAGCCSIYEISHGLAEIRCFAVKEDFNGRGIGKALLDSCLAKARSQGVKRVFTITLEGEFFEKNGFTLMSKHKIPLATFKSEPDFSPIRFARWMLLFLKMLSTDSAYELHLS